MSARERIRRESGTELSLRVLGTVIALVRHPCPEPVAIVCRVHCRHSRVAFVLDEGAEVGEARLPVILDEVP